MNTHRKDIGSSESLQKVLNKRITIYGAYFPKTELQRLKDLRKFLKKKGLKRVFLVMNYPRSFFKFPYIEGEDEYIYEKSIYCVEKSDLNVFVYTYEGRLEGETVELIHAIDHKKDFLTFVETGETLPACSRIITGRLDKLGIRYFPFPKKDDKYLQDAVYHRIYDFFM